MKAHLDQSAGTKARTRPKSMAGRWLTAYPRAIPLAIFLAIAAVTALSVFTIELGEADRERSQMRATAQSISSSLERRGNTSSSYLRAGAALFATVDEINLTLFKRFVRELRLDSAYRGAEGIGWAEVVRPADVEAFEHRIGAEMSDGMAVQHSAHSSPDRLVPVTFLQPDTERNRRAMGYDMYSEPNRRAAMDEAERLVRPTASGKIVLVQEGGGDAPGFLIYMPVFVDGPNQSELKGFVYSPFSAQAFLESAIDSVAIGEIGVQLFDGPENAQNLLAVKDPGLFTGITIEQEVTIANRPLTLVVESARGEYLSSLSIATLIFGLAVATLLMLMARMLTQQAVEDQASLEYLEQQNSIRDSLSRELNHRVKNTLANVLSIISLTRRRTDDLDEFADGLAARVRAISATHDLLTQSEWGTTPIRSIIEAEAAPYLRMSDSTLELSGPQVEVAPNDALSLGLAIHELATNAAKFGALSVPEGRVSVDWAFERDGVVILTWREVDGPPVSPLREPGFGMELIEKIVAHELKSPVDLRFDETGVSCALRVPVRKREDFQIRQAD
ncbi:MAG: CHASE domain-containing protein [Erythrobacter sp.]